MAAPAVCYAAKSTADEHGSIPTQLADCRAAAESEGRQVVGEYHDEAASAYKGNRGSGLAQAMEHAERLNGELWVQHSDRLARGDGKRAKHLVEYALWALKADITIRSVQDPQTFGDLLYAVVTGQRNNEDSERKSASVRSGLKRRAERGEPVGAIPYGYRIEAMVGQTQKSHTQRVIERGSAGIVNRIFDLVEAGHTFGDVARALNADGLKTRRGKQWTTRAVRRIVLNEDYTGSTGYPQLIDPQRHARILASVKRLDAVAVQARKGGRLPVDDYMLRGVAFCGLCGSSLYTRRYASGRHYLCSAVREARGTCDAVRIPADLIEAETLGHLHDFKLNVVPWLKERAGALNSQRAELQRAAERLQEDARKRAVRVQRAQEQYTRLLDTDPDLATTSLREIARLEADRDEAVRVAHAAQLRADEFAGEPPMDVALDFFTQVTDVILGRLDRAEGMAALNVALRGLLAGAWLHVDEQGRVHGRFRLRADEETFGRLADITPPEDMAFVVGETEPQTLVNGPVRLGVEIPPLVVAGGGSV